MQQSPWTSPTGPDDVASGGIVPYANLTSAGDWEEGTATDLAMGVGLDVDTDWLADLRTFSDLEHLGQSVRVPADRPLIPVNRTRAKKQRMRLRHSARDMQAYTSPTLAKSYLEPWNRAEEVETWRFCANEMLSYVSLYARAGSSPMMSQRTPATTKVAPVLAKALGICAAHETLGGTQRGLFDEMLDREMEELIESSTAAEYSIMDQQRSLDTIVGKSVARLQALILYQIIRLFSDKTRDVAKAKAQEALLASWTRELQLQIQLLQQTSPTYDSSPSIGPVPLTVDREVLESAYRTILISYEVRAVHSVLAYRNCPVWEDLFAIVVPPSLSGSKKLMYPDYVVEWDRGLALEVTGDDRRFRDLIVAACKGVDAVRSRSV